MIESSRGRVKVYPGFVRGLILLLLGSLVLSGESFQGW